MQTLEGMRTERVDSSSPNSNTFFCRLAFSTRNSSSTDKADLVYANEHSSACERASERERRAVQSSPFEPSIVRTSSLASASSASRPSSESARCGWLLLARSSLSSSSRRDRSALGLRAPRSASRPAGRAGRRRDCGLLSYSYSYSH